MRACVRAYSHWTDAQLPPPPFPSGVGGGVSLFSSPSGHSPRHWHRWWWRAVAVLANSERGGQSADARRVLLSRRVTWELRSVVANHKYLRRTVTVDVSSGARSVALIFWLDGLVGCDCIGGARSFSLNSLVGCSARSISASVGAATCALDATDAHKQLTHTPTDGIG